MLAFDRSFPQNIKDCWDYCNKEAIAKKALEMYKDRPSDQDITKVIEEYKLYFNLERKATKRKGGGSRSSFTPTKNKGVKSYSQYEKRGVDSFHPLKWGGGHGMFPPLSSPSPPLVRLDIYHTRPRSHVDLKLVYDHACRFICVPILDS